MGQANVTNLNAGNSSVLTPDNTADFLQEWVQLGITLKWLSEQSKNENEELSQYVEEKVSDIIRNFYTFAEDTEKQSKTVEAIVETATSVRIDGATVSYVDIISRLDELMNVMINDIVDVSKGAMNMVYVMKQVVESSEEINDDLAKIF